jgi:hypothetical protein
MGIIIVPFILIAILMFMVSMAITIIGFAKKQIKISTFLFGLPLTGLISGTVIFYRFQESSVNNYAILSFPFFMIYIPFFVGILLKIISVIISTKIFIDQIIFSSIIFSAILLSIYFYNYPTLHLRPI